MALTPRLDLRQAQSLVMTPQLQQAIKLLQLSSMEIAAYVDEQLEQNPLLEKDDAGDDALEASTIDSDPEVAPPQDGGDPRSVDAAVTDDTPIDPDSAFDVDSYENFYDTDSGDVGGNADLLGQRISDNGSHGAGRAFELDERTVDETLSARTTLRDHLTSQLSVDIDDPVDRLIGVHLIDLLDDTGYLIDDLSHVGETLGCPLEHVEATLARLQKFDPPGVFARNLSECLALQLNDRGLLDPTMITLLNNLDLVAKRDWSALARICSVGSKTIARMVGEIRSLNPKPALAFDDNIAQPVIPDVIMRPRPNGGWIVELSSEALPRVLVNNHYYAYVSGMASRREDKQFINECLQSANWLVKTLHQRATTILKVASDIVRQQEAFFLHGVHALKPLILRDVAEEIEMHESTVSRVTSNKFMATPRGIFELKYFFTHGIGGAQGGEVHSAESVRHRLKALIDGETANRVLSDDQLADILQKEGIDIARRTVAKYRESMRIESSVQRRRSKKAQR